MCILICAGLWGFIMRSLNLPNDELYRRPCVRVCVCNLESTPQITDNNPFLHDASNVSLYFYIFI